MQKRKLNRLKNYDYSSVGYYFVTVCTHGKINWFGKIKNGEMMLNECGTVVENCWLDLSNHYGNFKLDYFVIMPNHFHGIFFIDNTVGDGLKPSPTKYGLSEIVRGFKTFSSKKINQIMQPRNHFRWQRSFYDHIIRNECDLNRIRQYIIDNPLQWEMDEENVK